MRINASVTKVNEYNNLLSLPKEVLSKRSSSSNTISIVDKRPKLRKSTSKKPTQKAEASLKIKRTRCMSSSRVLNSFYA